MSVSSVSPSQAAELARQNYRAEKQANERIEAANKRAKEAERQLDQNLERLRESDERQRTAESARQEEMIEKKRSDGYERLRDLHRSQEAELRKLRRRGETENLRLQDHYRSSIHQLEDNGNNQLESLSKQIQQRLDYEKQVGDLESNQHRAQHELEMQNLKQNSEETLGKLQKKSDNQLKMAKEQAEKLSDYLQKNFNEKTQNIQKHHHETISELNQKATDQIKEIRKDTSHKLAAYHDRQSDPFYKLMRLDAKLWDDGDAFMLKVKIPDYEQKNFSALVKGDNLVVSGHRKSEEALELGKGREIASSSYQSYHESFPLNWPVDASRLTRESDGDTIIVTVPKQNKHSLKLKSHLKLDKLRIEPPVFPEDIRNLSRPEDERTHTKNQKEEIPEIPPDPFPFDPGSGTLA